MVTWGIVFRRCTPVVLLIGIIASCNRHQHLVKPISSHPLADTLVIHVEALNLTEDGTAMSSQNDEVICLLYQELDSATVIVKMITSFTLTKQRREKTLVVPQDTVLKTHPYCIFILEQDSDRQASEIATVISSQYNELKRNFRKSGNFATESIIGDDDIIGIHEFKALTTKMKTTFTFQGVYRLDRFDYRVEIKGL
jgi:hypothetical protein